MTTQEKKVTWLELFFDLVFVYAITRISELVHEDHSPAGVLRALVVFVPIYWAWVGNTMHANLHDLDRGRDRVGVLAVAFCGLLLALAVPEAYHDNGLLFGTVYLAARLVLFLLVAGRENRTAFATFTIGLFVTGPLLVVGAMTHGTPRLVIWAVAALVDLSVPSIMRRRLATIPFEPGHLTERYGTFVIIALGETVVATAVGANAHHLYPMRLLAVAVAFTVCAGLWWVYFAFSPTTIHEELSHTDHPIDIIRPVLSYGHLGYLAGIIGVAAAIGGTVEEPGQHLHPDLGALLFGGTAVYLVTFAFTRWRLFRTLASPAWPEPARVWCSPSYPGGCPL